MTWQNIHAKPIEELFVVSIQNDFLTLLRETAAPNTHYMCMSKKNMLSKFVINTLIVASIDNILSSISIPCFIRKMV
jgi:hypothetical protein